MRYKLLNLIFLILLILPVRLAADWQIKLTVANHGSGSVQLLGEAYLGEAAGAQNGYDWQYDLAYLYPPMNPSYVVPYFVHSDWGLNNGNYSVDIRFTNPATKIWDTRIKTQNPLSYNYTLSWAISGVIPAYYNPRLVHGQASIDLRTQSSYSFVSAASLTTCSIRMEYDPSIPYLLYPLEDLLFSDNQPQRINLSRHFQVATGSLTYTFSASENLVQSIEAEGDSVYWELYPQPGWTGQTSVEISALANAHRASQVVNIWRDSTNSPPQLWQAVPTLQLIQNQSAEFSWAGLFFDADGDSLSLEIDDTATIQVVYDPVAETAMLIPAAGFKGETSLYIWLYDGHNPPVGVQLELLVQPSQPETVHNLQLYQSWDAGLICSWDAVLTDVSGAPVSGIVYELLISEDPSFAAAAIRLQRYTEGTSVQIPSALPTAFIKIIAINE